MATLSELVKVIAAVQGLDENQVLWIARYLREDGLIAKGGRGKGGAKMGIADASNLLIGVNAPGSAKQSADLVRYFSEMPLIQDYAAPNKLEEWDQVRSGDQVSEAFRRGSKFGNALKALILERIVTHGDVSADEIRVTLIGPDLSARIYVGEGLSVVDGETWTSSTFSSATELVEADGQPPDQEVSKTFTHKTVNEVARILSI